MKPVISLMPRMAVASAFVLAAITAHVKQVSQSVSQSWRPSAGAQPTSPSKTFMWRQTCYGSEGFIRSSINKRSVTKININVMTDHLFTSE